MRGRSPTFWKVPSHLYESRLFQRKAQFGTVSRYLQDRYAIAPLQKSKLNVAVARIMFVNDLLKFGNVLAVMHHAEADTVLTFHVDSRRVFEASNKAPCD